MPDWQLVKDDKSHWHYKENEPMLKLVGLYGPSRSGKDETAKILVKDFGFEQRAQADAIRQILLGLDPLLRGDDDAVWSLRSLHNSCDGDWNLIKEKARESTDLMIRLGQTCRDVLGIDTWLNTVIPSAEDKAKIVISDIRQPNEYRAIKDRGGEVWKISRPGVEYRGMDGLLERYEFDARIENRGSLQDLRGVVASMIVKSINTAAPGPPLPALNISYRNDL